MTRTPPSAFLGTPVRFLPDSVSPEIGILIAQINARQLEFSGTSFSVDNTNVTNNHIPLLQTCVVGFTTPVLQMSRWPPRNWDFSGFLQLQETRQNSNSHLLTPKPNVFLVSRKGQMSNIAKQNHSSFQIPSSVRFYGCDLLGQICLHVLGQEIYNVSSNLKST